MKQMRQNRQLGARVASEKSERAKLTVSDEGAVGRVVVVKLSLALLVLVPRLLQPLLSSVMLGRAFAVSRPGCSFRFLGVVDMTCRRHRALVVVVVKVLSGGANCEKARDRGQRELRRKRNETEQRSYSRFL